MKSCKNPVLTATKKQKLIIHNIHMLKCESLRSIEGESVINTEKPKNEEDKHIRE